MAVQGETVQYCRHCGEPMADIVGPATGEVISKALSVRGLCAVCGRERARSKGRGLQPGAVEYCKACGKAFPLRNKVLSRNGLCLACRTERQRLGGRKGGVTSKASRSEPELAADVEQFLGRRVVDLVVELARSDSMLRGELLRLLQTADDRQQAAR